MNHLKENFISYFKNKLKLKETYDLYNQSINKNLGEITVIKLCDNRDDLGDCDLSIINLIKLLRNNYKHLFSLIINLEEEDKDEMADLIGHFFYENILVLDPEHEEILNFCYLLLEKEINEMSSPNVNEFLENSFIGRIFKNLFKRSDVKNYLSLAVKDIIMKLENLSENFMELDLDKIYHYVRNSVNDHSMFANHYLEKTKTIYSQNKLDALAYNLHKSTILDHDFHEQSVFSRNKTNIFNEVDPNSSISSKSIDNKNSNSFIGKHSNISESNSDKDTAIEKGKHT